MAFDEKTLVEDYIVQKLQDKGWQFLPADSLERDSYEEPLLITNLVRALERINERIGIGDDEINRVVNELKLTGTGIEGARRILNFYKFGVPIKFEKEKVVKYVQLFDFEEIEDNDFVVTRQVNYDGRERIRTDIMLYINGFPLVNIECKNPVSISESWYRAYSQIKDYEKTVPELYKYVQIGIAAETKARYFPIVPWFEESRGQEEAKIHEWREKKKDSVDSTVEMLSRVSLLDIISNFLFFRVEFGNATKVITRYMQYRAANKIVNRVREFLESEVSLVSKESRASRERVSDSIDSMPPRLRSKGLIWHWQGSGKTLTMIFAANKLYYMKELENPTIFFVVDRTELEEQLSGELHSLDIVKPEVIGSIEELREVLSYDDYRGKRGVFITLIHKFRPEELDELSKEIEKVSRHRETIRSRKNSIVFVDEGHRTQYGLLAAQMKAILKSAFFFALTGTPISKRGRDTYLEFSYAPEELYLDRYFITDSIRDGFTVKIVYQPRLEKEVHLKKEMLKVFLETEFEELPEEIREDVEQRVKKKLNTIKLILENPERIKVVAEDIAQHFKENIDGKFKAMVVAASRRACVLYKRELDKHLPGDYSEPVMSYTREDPHVIREYAKEPKVRYGDTDMDQIKKRIVENFKEEEFPKILIVTDMLLTGFDAPVLQVMYLDKLLKEHRLLQAVARTNRPFRDLKEAGVVIDYVGIVKEFKKALEIYSEEDIKEALFSYDSVKEEFVELIEEILEILGEVPRNYRRQTLLKAVELLTSNEEKEKEFVEKYKNSRRIFELLGPDEIKLEYFDIYKWLSAIYTYYTKIVIQKPTYGRYVQKYYEKTVRFVHKTTEIEKLEKGLPVIAFDEEYLKKLEERIGNRKEKAANILFTLNRFVLVERYRNPIYESLVEKVERLLEIWKEKTKDYERIYIEGSRIIDEIRSLSKRQKDLGFSELEYSMLLVLEGKLGRENELIEEAKDLSAQLEKFMFAGWLTQTTVRKEVEREVRRFVRGLKGRYSLSLDELDDLYEKLIESVKSYGAS